VNGPHKFVEKTCCNEHLREYSKWGLFFNEKYDKSLQFKKIAKKGK
jgi:hypothetical protein